MPMTKKEQAAMQAAIDRAETLAALRWTEKVACDVPPPTPLGGKYSEGWNYNAHTRTVWQGWSTSVSHGEGPAPADGQRYYSGSQHPRSMFSSKVLALKALRHAVEERSAQQLLEIDRMIASAKAEGEGGT